MRKLARDILHGLVATRSAKRFFIFQRRFLGCVIPHSLFIIISRDLVQIFSHLSFLPLCRGSPPDLADEVVANEVEMVDMRKVDGVEVPKDTAKETESDSECKQDVASCSEVEEVEALAEPVTVQPLPSKESIGEIHVTEHGEFPAEHISFDVLISRRKSC